MERHPVLIGMEDKIGLFSFVTAEVVFLHILQLLLDLCPGPRVQ